MSDEQQRDTTGEADFDPGKMREQYRAEGVGAEDFAADPMTQFGRWFQDAARAGLFEPNAMVVSTVDAEGRPSSRTVLLKGYGPDGFVFYTNYTSRKGRELAGNPNIALLFPWHPMARQVLVAGTAERVGREETARYFRTRPHGSQLGAWASAQSTVVESRGVLEAEYARLVERYPEGERVPVPAHWGGFRVTPRTVEFWQGRRNRLHDRLRYAKPDEGGTAWQLSRLNP